VSAVPAGLRVVRRVHASGSRQATAALLAARVALLLLVAAAVSAGVVHAQTTGVIRDALTGLGTVGALALVAGLNAAVLALAVLLVGLVKRIAADMRRLREPD
jgi:hypothetical protein